MVGITNDKKERFGKSKEDDIFVPFWMDVDTVLEKIEEDNNELLTLCRMVTDYDDYHKVYDYNLKNITEGRCFGIIPYNNNVKLNSKEKPKEFYSYSRIDMDKVELENQKIKTKLPYDKKYAGVQGTTKTMHGSLVVSAMMKTVRLFIQDKLEENFRFNTLDIKYVNPAKHSLEFEAEIKQKDKENIEFEVTAYDTHEEQKTTIGTILVDRNEEKDEEEISPIPIVGAMDIAPGSVAMSVSNKKVTFSKSLFIKFKNIPKDQVRLSALANKSRHKENEIDVSMVLEDTQENEVAVGESTMYVPHDQEEQERIDNLGNMFKYPKLAKGLLRSKIVINKFKDKFRKK